MKTRMIFVVMSAVTGYFAVMGIIHFRKRMVTATQVTVYHTNEITVEVISGTTSKVVVPDEKNEVVVDDEAFKLRITTTFSSELPPTQVVSSNQNQKTQ